MDVFSRLSLVCLAIGLLAGCDGLSPPTKSETLRLELSKRQTQVYGNRLADLPDEGLEQTGGEPFSFDDLPAKPVLLAAIYTNCPMEKMCPLLTSKIGKVQSRVAESSGADSFHLVLVSFDPERDSPADVKAYATERGVDADHATFVSGEPEAVSELMEAIEIATKPAGDGTLTHNLRTYVTDASGRIVYGFRQAKWNPKHVTQRLRRAVAHAE